MSWMSLRPKWHRSWTGEFCGDDLTDIEATGFVDDAGNTHVVHCGEEH